MTSTFSLDTTAIGKISATTYVAVTVVFAALYAFYQWLLPKPIPGIPYNRDAAKSIWGDSPDMIREISVTSEFNLWCAKQVEKLGSPICQVFIGPFEKPWVLLADFGESEDIMMRRKEFDRSEFISDRMAPLGYFHARFRTDDQWKQNRQWLQDLMSPPFLNDQMGPAVENIMNTLVELWKSKARLAEGRPFNASEDLNDVSLDVMLWFSFGQHLGFSAVEPQRKLVAELERSDVEVGDFDQPVEFPPAPLHDFLKASHKVTDFVEQIVNSLTPVFSLWWLKKMPWFKSTWSVTHRIVRQHIRSAVGRLHNERARTAIEHMMMREEKLAGKAGRRPNFEGQGMIDEIYGDLTAGHHTTGAALGWITKFLTENPSVQVKLRSTLRAAYTQAAEENRTPTFAEVNRIKVAYLDAVIEEALRLHSTTVTREALEDTELLGHKIPKGTTVFCVSNGPGFYSPALPVNDAKRSASSRGTKLARWDESKDLGKFDPERWLVESEGGKVEFDPMAGPQLIFGLGTRGCYGKKLAFIEMKLMTTAVVWNFELLGTPAALSSHASTDGISHRAKQCYVRLKALQD